MRANTAIHFSLLNVCGDLQLTFNEVERSALFSLFFSFICYYQHNLECSDVAMSFHYRLAIPHDTYYTMFASGVLK